MESEMKVLLALFRFTHSTYSRCINIYGLFWDNALIVQWSPVNYVSVKHSNRLDRLIIPTGEGDTQKVSNAPFYKEIIKLTNGARSSRRSGLRTVGIDTKRTNESHNRKRSFSSALAGAGERFLLQHNCMFWANEIMLSVLGEAKTENLIKPNEQ